MAHLQPARPSSQLGSPVSRDIPERQEEDADCPDFADGNNTVAETQGRGWAAPASHEGLWLALLVLGSAKVGCHALLQGFFPTQGSNPGLRHCQWILSHMSHQGSIKTENPHGQRSLMG